MFILIGMDGFCFIDWLINKGGHIFLTVDIFVLCCIVELFLFSCEQNVNISKWTTFVWRNDFYFGEKEKVLLPSYAFISSYYFSFITLLLTHSKNLDAWHDIINNSIRTLVSGVGDHKLSFLRSCSIFCLSELQVGLKQSITRRFPSWENQYSKEKLLYFILCILLYTYIHSVTCELNIKSEKYYKNVCLH